MIIAISDSTQFERYADFQKQLVNLLHSDVDYLIIRENQLDDDVYTSLLLSLLSEYRDACRKIVVYERAMLARNIGLTYVYLSGEGIYQSRQSHTKYCYQIEGVEQLELVDKEDLFIVVNPFENQINKSSISPIKSIVKEIQNKSTVNVAAYTSYNSESLEQLRKMGFCSVAMSAELMNMNNYKQVIAHLKQEGF